MANDTKNPLPHYCDYLLEEPAVSGPDYFKYLNERTFLLVSLVTQIPSAQRQSEYIRHHCKHPNTDTLRRRGSAHNRFNQCFTGDAA